MKHIPITAIAIGFFFLLAAFTSIPATHLNLADNPDAVLGTWLNGSKKGHIQIVKEGNQYVGKLVWMKGPNEPGTNKPQVDDKNEDPKLRSRPLLNLPLMTGFKHNGSNVWNDGKIYNPEDGKTYSCKMTLKDPNTLDVRGYVGISMFGKTQTWTRVK